MSIERLTSGVEFGAEDLALLEMPSRRHASTGRREPESPAPAPPAQLTPVAQGLQFEQWQVAGRLVSDGQVMGPVQNRTMGTGGQGQSTQTSARNLDDAGKPPTLPLGVLNLTHGSGSSEASVFLSSSAERGQSQATQSQSTQSQSTQSQTTRSQTTQSQTTQSQSTQSQQGGQAQQSAAATQLESGSLTGVLDLSVTGSRGGATALLAANDASATGAGTSVAVDRTAQIKELLAGPLKPTADDIDIAFLELSLADSLVHDVILHYGVSLKPLAANETTLALAQRYGVGLTQRLAQFNDSVNAVLSDYNDAMAAAATHEPGADGGMAGVMGWRLIAGQEGNGDVEAVPAHWNFDPVAFTQQYAQGDSLAEQAFNRFFGPEFLKRPEPPSGVDAVPIDYESGPGWGFESVAVSESQDAMRWRGFYFSSGTIDINQPPKMYDPTAVWFDPLRGWTTSGENIKGGTSVFWDQVAPMVIITVASWGAGTALAGAATVGMSGTAAALTTGAIMGAVGAVFSGLAFNGRVTLGDLVKGAVLGALSAGISDKLGFNTAGLDQTGKVVDWGARALAMGQQATLSGVMQELSGGKFWEGFGSGLATAFATEVGRGFNAQIDVLAQQEGWSQGQVDMCRNVGRVLTTAISALGNPDDPAAAFAKQYLEGLTKDVLSTPQNTAQQDFRAGEIKEQNSDAVATATVQWPGSGTVGAADGTTAFSDAQSGDQLLSTGQFADGNDAVDLVGGALGYDAAADSRADPNDSREWIEQSDEILFRRGDELAEAGGLNGVRLDDGSIRLPNGRLVWPSGFVLDGEGAGVPGAGGQSRGSAVVDQFPGEYRFDTRISIAGPSGLTKPDGSPATYTFDLSTGQVYWDLGADGAVREIPRAFKQPTLQELVNDPSNIWTQGPRLGDSLAGFGFTTATGVLGLATGGWAFGAARGVGHGLFASGGAAGFIGDLTTQVADNAVWFGTGGDQGRFGINDAELALSTGLGLLPGLPGAVRGWAQDMRALGVPDWNIRFTGPQPGVFYSNPVPLEFEKIEGAVSGQGLAQTSLDNAVGESISITATKPVGLSDFDRLNVVDPAVNRLRPGEAGAAAELESYLGGTLARAPGGSSVDFVFVGGPNDGKTVDFMLTPDTFEQAMKLNQFFEKNLPNFMTTLRDHAAIADFVPMDTRFLNQSNRALLEESIGQLPAELRSKIILLRSGQ